jgi:hypothetical protein
MTTSSSDQTSDTTILFIKYKAMLGDGDGWIKEHVFMTEKEWRQEVAVFKKCIEKTGRDTVERWDPLGEYQTGLKDYTVTPCTVAEKEAVERLFGESYFTTPSELTEWHLNEEEYEAALASVV